VPPTTSRLHRTGWTKVFNKYGTTALVRAFASVGPCTSAAPQHEGWATSRRCASIAEEAFARCSAREYKGSHSGEPAKAWCAGVTARVRRPDRQGRSRRFKDNIRPARCSNGQDRGPSKMDAARVPLPEGYRPSRSTHVLDCVGTGRIPAAVESENNNGECRKADPGVSARPMGTGDEINVRAARAPPCGWRSGPARPRCHGSDGMRGPGRCVLSCKGCRRECPTGVDMAKMTSRVLNQWQRRPRPDREGTG